MNKEIKTKKNLKKNKSEKTLFLVAFTEILILILAIFSFSYILGNSFVSVDARSIKDATVNSPQQVIQNTTQGTLQNTPGFQDIAQESISITMTSELRNQLRSQQQKAIDSGVKYVEAFNSGVTGKELEKLKQDYISDLNEIGSIAEKGGIEGVTQEGINKAISEEVKNKAAETGASATAAETVQVGKEIPGWGGLIDVKRIGKNMFVAGLIKLTVTGILKLAGVDPQIASNIGTGASTGYFIAVHVIGSFTSISSWILGPIGAGVGILIALLITKEERYDLYEFNCLVWNPPRGGDNCHLCNNQEFPCTEYRCKSLGNNCQIVNPGTTDEKCVSITRIDNSPPQIQPWKDVLTEGYSYIPNNAISPPSKGVKIVSEKESGCIAPFTPLTFGIQLDELAICKTSNFRTDNFADMNSFLSSGMYKENHSLTLSLPTSKQIIDKLNVSIEPDSDFIFYLRCEDFNGNSNIPEFSFSFCVDAGPDTIEPKIVSTSILNNSPIAFNIDKTDLTVYLDKPAECKWDLRDQAYDDLSYDMDCFSSDGFGIGTHCIAKLEGIKQKQNNDYYFRCKSYPDSEEKERYANQRSYLFRLIGTEPLVINSVVPNNTIIKDSVKPTVNIQARTSAGYQNGISNCYVNYDSSEGYIAKFDITNSHTHSHNLPLLEKGYYDFDITCIDSAGNSDSRKIEFKVEIDREAPIVVRAFRDGNNLKIMTDEEAECVYSTDSCSYDFEDGIKMSSSNNMHSIAWRTDENIYIKYIKCKDAYENRPRYDQCSIVLKPFELK